MPKDREWNHFITESDHLVDPRVPVRNVEHINYPGKDHPAAVEVRSGMLERKSKYLKSYTPGWSVTLSSIIILAFLLISPSPLNMLIPHIFADFITGTFCHQRIFTSSNLRIESHSKRPLYPYTSQNRSWARIRSPVQPPTNSCSKDDKLERCTAATHGCSEQSRMKR
jgi:PH (Pleckstrin Homology) domain-containing protein